MKHSLLLLVTVFLLSINYVSGQQNVAINTTGDPANPSAILDVQSTDKGLLIPRMTSAERLSISSPATGLIVYDITTQSLWHHDNSEWKEMAIRDGLHFVWEGGAIHNTGDIGNDNFVFGSTHLDENGVADHRKRFFFEKNKAAIRGGQLSDEGSTATIDESKYWDLDSLGTASVSFGYNTLAKNVFAVAIGANARATGYASVAIGATVLSSGGGSVALGVSTASGDRAFSAGSSNNAIGFASTALGELTRAAGKFSTSLGQYTSADSYGAVAIGRANVGGGDATNWFEFDPIFEIGIGENSSNRANAMTVLKSGNTGFGTYIPTHRVHIADMNQALRLEGENDGFLKSGATMNFGDGNYVYIREFGDDSTNMFSHRFLRLGSSTAYIEILGHTNNDLIMGAEIAHLAVDRIAGGLNARADAMMSCALGSFNVGGGNPDSWVPTDPIFEVGNSTDENNPSNAFTIYKNGRVGINHRYPEAMLDIDQPNEGPGNGVLLNLGGVGHWETMVNTSGDYNFYYNNVRKAHLTSSGDFRPSKVTLPGTADVGLATDGDLIIGSASGWNLSIDNNEIMARNNGSTHNLLLQKDGGGVGIGRDVTANTLEVNGNASKSSAGDWLANSDARLKTDITQLDGEEMLEKLLSLKGVNFKWADNSTGYERPTGVQYGMIAQDIIGVFPEFVIEDEKGFLQTAYGTYDPIFIEAFRAMNNRFEQLTTENAMLKQEIKELKELVNRLDQRVSQIHEQ